jgi:hypothetical protein
MFAQFDLQVDNSLHILGANSELSGKFEEKKSIFKRQGRLDCAGASY